MKSSVHGALMYFADGIDVCILSGTYVQCCHHSLLA